MSTEVGLGACCLSGNLHDGTPVGTVETIGGLQTYVSGPKDGSKAKTVIFITDIFGYGLNNVRLLADNYANAGFYTYIPDLLKGDPLPQDFLHSVEPNLKTQESLGIIDKGKNAATVATTLPPWLMKHREAVVKPMLDEFIDTIRAIPGTKKVGALGFCWGGRYAILEAHTSQGSGGVDAAFACHPSLVTIPGDFDPVTKPLGIAIGDHDSLLDKASIDKVSDILKKKNIPQEVKVYPDQIHGFALRGDWSSDNDKQAMDDAEKQSINWFNTYLV